MYAEQPGFLEAVRELGDRCGAVLIVDEITLGWRLVLGGARLRYGVVPDTAVFAKTISNGHPMAAVIGRAAIAVQDPEGSHGHANTERPRAKCAPHKSPYFPHSSCYLIRRPDSAQ